MRWHIAVAFMAGITGCSPDATRLDVRHGGVDVVEAAFQVIATVWSKSFSVISVTMASWRATLGHNICARPVFPLDERTLFTPKPVAQARG